ncbi:M20/M25/M40 family metallo-hydrolase [Neorhodopirellula pilleata]|uniref:Acetylornithine deacetylase n=1 Tax=Neorhodopirellula pilleata TaxID=2714738 RepID=A0A5C5ZP95_9BACT|nr:M20/M25/M40 family metallo-hydrolase [Neorhodopirellula pilleata]TWT89289.1 Acetylornithine deacetylase [Neorhodopirellula pilleata]
MSPRPPSSNRVEQPLSVEHVLTELIGFNTVSHLSNEAITRYVADHLARIGFVIELTQYRDRRETLKFNLIARRDPNVASEKGSESSGLAYFCHTDVVSADRWSGPGGDPFRASVDKDRIYGRGACDMKGSLAAMMAAASRVTIDEQTAPLWIVATADEEVGFEGARCLVDSSSAYREIVAADPVSIIGEPSRLRIVYAHKGIIGLQIHSVGQAAHSSTSEGVNANIAMVPMLQTLLEIDQRCRHDKSLQDDRFDPPTLTWNFGVSDRMRTVNIVPDHSTAWVSFRTMPNVDGAELIDQVLARAGELGLQVEKFAGGPPMATSLDQPCVGEMCDLAERFIGPNEPAAECYATDGCVFDELSRRIVCGPGSIAQAHKTDEFIARDELTRGVDFYESAIRHWCGK